MADFLLAHPGTHTHVETESGEKGIIPILFYAISPNNNVNHQNYYVVRPIDAEGHNLWNVCTDRDCAY